MQKYGDGNETEMKQNTYNRFRIWYEPAMENEECHGFVPTINTTLTSK